MAWRRRLTASPKASRDTTGLACRRVTGKLARPRLSWTYMKRHVVRRCQDILDRPWNHARDSVFERTIHENNHVPFISKFVSIF